MEDAVLATNQRAAAGNTAGPRGGSARFGASVRQKRERETQRASGEDNTLHSFLRRLLTTCKKVERDMPSTRSHGRVQPTLSFPRRKSCRVSSRSKAGEKSPTKTLDPVLTRIGPLSPVLTRIGPLSPRRPAEQPALLSPTGEVIRLFPLSPRRPAAQPPSSGLPTPSGPPKRLPLSPRKRTGDDSGCNTFCYFLQVTTAAVTPSVISSPGDDSGCNTGAGPLGSPPKQSKPTTASPRKLGFDENSPISARRRLVPSPPTAPSPRQHATPAGSPARQNPERKSPANSKRTSIADLSPVQTVVVNCMSLRSSHAVFPLLADRLKAPGGQNGLRRFLTAPGPA
ncbi:hypothetical protein FQN60_018580, partial [Etheostoma spectabile]